MKNIKSCESCGMQINEKENIEANKYCIHCTDDSGNLKSYDEVKEGMTQLAIKLLGVSPKKAKEVVERNMHNLPAWKK